MLDVHGIAAGYLNRYNGFEIGDSAINLKNIARFEEDAVCRKHSTPKNSWTGST